MNQGQKGFNMFLGKKQHVYVKYQLLKYPFSFLKTWIDLKSLKTFNIPPITDQVQLVIQGETEHIYHNAPNKGNIVR